MHASWGAVARVHRRHGGAERVLAPSEIAPWGARIAAILPTLRRKETPMYVMWGTDYRDAPLRNAAALSEAVPAAARLDWAAEQKNRARTSRNGIAGLFARSAEIPKIPKIPEIPEISHHENGERDARACRGLRDIEDRARRPSAVGPTRGPTRTDEEGVSPRAGAKRPGSGPAPVAKRAKHSTIARMFAKCASPEKKR